jgi:hypothetical protein
MRQLSIRFKLSIRFLLPAILAMVAATPLFAEEGSRTWTNTKGKTVIGTLQEKGEGWAMIEIKGKVHKIALSTLSKVDQIYVENAKLDAKPAPEEPPSDEPKPDDPVPGEPAPAKEPMPDDPMPDDPEGDDAKPKEDDPASPGKLAEVVGLTVSEADPEAGTVDDNSHTAVRLKLEVNAVSKAGVHCILVWVASFRGGGGIAVHSRSEDFFGKDGEYYVQQIFSNNPQSGASYKGYAVRLLNTKFQKVAEMASESKYAKYLDDAQREVYPDSLPAEEEEDK